MKSRNKIIGKRRIIAKKSGKHWTIYYIDISDKETEGVAAASVWVKGGSEYNEVNSVWVQPGTEYNVGDEIDVVFFNGRYFAI